MHWASNYIGIPFKFASSNNKGADCWGLVKLIYKQEYNIELPKIEVVDYTSTLEIMRQFKLGEGKENWVRIEKPKEGDAVLMSLHNLPSHIGIWIESQGLVGILHTANNCGSVFLKQGNFTVYNTLGYYKYNGSNINKT